MAQLARQSLVARTRAHLLVRLPLAAASIVELRKQALVGLGGAGEGCSVTRPYLVIPATAPIVAPRQQVRVGRGCSVTRREDRRRRRATPSDRREGQESGCVKCRKHRFCALQERRKGER